MGCIWPKYIIFELKKYRGVIFHDTEDWCKIWRKTELWFGKWHEEFGKFSPEHSKFSELGLWWDPFIQIKKCMSLTFTGELRVMTMKNDAKFEEELTCQFKIDNEEFDKCWCEHSKISKICTLKGYFWLKYMFELKKYRRVTFEGTENWCKIWRKFVLCFQKWYEEFGKFSPEYSKFSKLELWWDPFIQSRKCTCIKFTGELCVMTMKNDANLKRN